MGDSLDFYGTEQSQVAELPRRLRCPDEATHSANLTDLLDRPRKRLKRLQTRMQARDRRSRDPGCTRG